jgi:hypothetical protein
VLGAVCISLILVVCSFSIAKWMYGRVDRTLLAHGTAANDVLEELGARPCLRGRFERVRSEDVANPRGRPIRASPDTM